MKTLTERQTLLTGLIVMPSSLVWILAEKAWIAIVVASAMYLLSAHIVPAGFAHLSAHKDEYTQNAWRVVASIRSAVVTRLTRA